MAVDKLRRQKVIGGLVRRYLAERERRPFEIAARRQSLAIAERTLDQNTDDAKVRGEIEAILEDDDFADEWRA